MKKKTKNAKKARSSVRNGDPVTDEVTPDEGVKRSRTPSPDYDKFVELWSTSASVSEVAEALDIKSNSASAIANRLRKAGVPLEKFPRRGSQPIDVKRLTKIASGKTVD